jgi:hypothetical protein
MLDKPTAQFFATVYSGHSQDLKGDEGDSE